MAVFAVVSARSWQRKLDPYRSQFAAVHPTTHSPRVSVAAAQRAPEPHGEEQPPIAVRRRGFRCRARAGAYGRGEELVTSPLRNIALLTFRLLGRLN